MSTGKNAEKFYCKRCDFLCSKNSEFERHKLTKKHLGVFVNKKNAENVKNFVCVCGKKYKERTGLWKHKKTCLESETLNTKNDDNDDKDVKEYDEDDENETEQVDKDVELIWTLVKQNQEFKEMMMEQQKFMMKLAQKPTTVNNTQNNQFNLQFFLNETCKNAMNINQFIDSIQIKMEDLEYTGKNGYVQGISNVIVRELKSLDQNERPMHCSDEKREIIYIKTNNVWEKDTNFDGVTRLTKHLAHKKFLKMKEWVEEHPTCMAYDDKNNDEYLSILGQIVSGLNHLNEPGNNDSLKKIVRAIVKQVVIRKK
jgi:hypothetical protein